MELKAVNHIWNKKYKKFIRKNSEQKVSFNETIFVKYMCCWNFASKQSRKGEWQQIVIDRFRFQQRIKTIEKSISYIFDPKHRAYHYFKNYVEKSI